MSDEGMSDAELAQLRKLIATGYGRCKMPDDLAGLIARLDAAERDRDALREALLSDDAITAAVLAHWGEPPINKVSAHLRSNQMRHAIRAALTANHSAPVVEE